MLFLSSILTGVKVASTGYVLAKQVFGDMQKSTSQPSKDFQKDFKKTPKSKRASLMKAFLEEKSKNDLKNQIYNEMKAEIYDKLKLEAEEEVATKLAKMLAKKVQSKQ